MTLPNDISRCCGYECARREQCARHQALNVPHEGVAPVHVQMCVEWVDMFIPVEAK